MKTLDEIATHWGTDKASWGHNYTAVYAPIMEPLRNQAIKILELGWGSGYSAATWLEYFPNATIAILDDNFLDDWSPERAPDPPDMSRIHRYQGDQCSEELIKKITDDHGLFDIIVDDASHILSKTMSSFALLWPWVHLGGYYIIEDIAVAYMNGEMGQMLNRITDTQQITIYPSLHTQNPWSQGVVDHERVAIIRKGTHMVTEYCDSPEWMTVQMDSGRYAFDVPTFMQPHAHMFANWERERFESMRAHLKHGDVFYDVGAEMGWQSLIYAQIVGPENMVLIEPSEAPWPNIRQTWNRNIDCPPMATYRGFMGSETNDEHPCFTPWPAETDAPLVVSISYKYLWESADDCPQMTLDDFIAQSRCVPDAINIDVEGAELAVLRGAENTFKFTKRPLVWVSLHPDLMRKWYNTTEDQVHEFMASCGYTGTHLATDHEEHWLFHP